MALESNKEKELVHKPLNWFGFFAAGVLLLPSTTSVDRGTAKFKDNDTVSYMQVRSEVIAANQN